MKAAEFKHQNTVFGEGQSEYKPLPALRLGDRNDTIITCYRLSWKERLQVLFTGRIWMSEMNFRRPLTPRYLTAFRDEVYTPPYCEDCGSEITEQTAIAQYGKCDRCFLTFFH